MLLLSPSSVRRLISAAALFAGLAVHAAAPASPAPAEAPRAVLVRALQATGSEQMRLLDQLGDSGSSDVREILTAWSRGEVYLYGSGSAATPILLEEQQDAAGKSRAIRIADGARLTDAAGRELRLSIDDLTAIDADLKFKAAIRQVQDRIDLSDPSPDARRAAAVKLGASQHLQYLPALRSRLTRESDPAVRRAIEESVAQIELTAPDPAAQSQAIAGLVALRAMGTIDSLKAYAQAHASDPAAAKAARNAVTVIEQHIQNVNFFGTVFRGLSLGSILLVVALGLAITFGLMGIINMAHGEMIGVGAYTCYVVQNLFGAGFSFALTLPFSFGGKPLAFGLHLPGLNASGGFYQSYFLFALPLSFLTAALVGIVVERTVIRFLYRRPLESLLATWGVSLVMQQGFRMIFGANNVQVNSPAWLLGHFAIDDVLFAYSRLFVIVFAILIVIGTWLLLTKTSLGLLIRAVMQGRETASSLGVRIERVNLMTFALGSGLAGLAGAFLSQIGNVGPSLGQSYIVDCFMTVVVGGVGSIVGTVSAAVGIGTSDQVLQQLLGSPVLGKIIVLGIIILFLQWKPGGLFSTRSRHLDS